jgi:thioredoxin 1
MARVFPQFVFVKVDVDDLPDVCDWAKISGMPTFIAYKDNKKLGEIVGADQNSLLEMLRKCNYY